jgi:hypothetical protein
MPGFNVADVVTCLLRRVNFIGRTEFTGMQKTEAFPAVDGMKASRIQDFQIVYQQSVLRAITCNSESISSIYIAVTPVADMSFPGSWFLPQLFVEPETFRGDMFIMDSAPDRNSDQSRTEVVTLDDIPDFVVSSAEKKKLLNGFQKIHTPLHRLCPQALEATLHADSGNGMTKRIEMDDFAGDFA